MNPDLHATALRLDEVVRTVPGVVSLFSSDAALVRATRELTATAVPAMISVSLVEGELVVAASVGVSTDQQAPVTARAVSDAIRRALGDLPISDIRVRISRVTP